MTYTMLYNVNQKVLIKQSRRGLSLNIYQLPMSAT